MRVREVMDMEDAGAAIVADALVRSAEPMPRDARARVRARLVSAMETDHVPLAARLMRPAVALAAAASLLGGVSYAAAAAAPGDLLYPVKAQLGRVADSVSHRAEPVRRVAPIATPPASQGGTQQDAGVRTFSAPVLKAPVSKPKSNSAAAVHDGKPKPKASAKSAHGNGKSEPGHGSKKESSKGRTQGVHGRVSEDARSSKIQEAKK